jgi:uncharacterized membrane protein YeaQ/YmgE (transglycosylase-associated protein family)
MTTSTIIVWLIIGALAGTLTGRVVTFSKQGLGFWTHMLLGMAGALLGGLVFWLFKIDLGLGEIRVSLEDLVAAIIGSLICVVAWRVWSRFAPAKSVEDKTKASSKSGDL